MTKVGTVIKGNLGADIIKGTTEAVGQLAKSALDVGMSFETSMSQVAATMGITSAEIQSGSKDFEMLSAKAKEMGATTKYTATEAADGLNILAMSGLSAEEACNGIADVMYLAGAGAMSLEEAATYTTGAVKGFGDTMDNASKYTDIMAKGATMANTDVKSLGEALSGASATASAYNQSVESTSVALLRLAEQNVTGSEAATALSRAMADLYTPTDKAATALEELGVATYDSQGNARDLNDVVDDLNAALEGMSDQQKLAYESTIFTTFGMKAFQKMTVSTKQTVDKFKKGIEEASGSAMEQFATQNDNLAGKLQILQSALEGLGLAIYEIFGEELKDAVEGATEVIDRISDSIKNGDLGASLERLADAFGKFAEEALETGEKALPVLIDALSWILENGDLIISAIVGITTANAVFGTIIPLIQGLQAAWIAYKTANEGATIAQWAMNAAMSANPIGLLMTALAAVVTALGTYIALNYDAEASLTECEKETKKLCDETERLNNTYKESIESRKKNRDDLESQGKVAEDLISKLESLQTAYNSGADNMTEMRMVVDQLNEAFPTLNLAIDEQTGALNMSTDAIRDNIDALLQQSKVEAAKADLTEIAKEQYEAEKKLVELREQKTKADQELADAEKTLAEMEEKFDTTTNAGIVKLSKYGQEVNNARDAVNNLDTQISETEQTISDLNDEYKTAYEYIGENTEAMNDLAEATENGAEANGDYSESINEVDEALQKEKDSLESTLQSQINSFDKVTEAAKQSKTEILQNLQDQLTAMENWSENMATLAARGIDDGLLEKLSQMGPEGAGYVQAFIDMTGPELEEAGRMFNESLLITHDTADRLATEYHEAGTNATQQFVDGEWVPIEDGAQEQVVNGMVQNLINSGEWAKLSPEAQQKILDAGKAMEESANDGQFTQAVPNAMVQALMNSPEWEKMSPQAREQILKASSGMLEGVESDPTLHEAVPNAMVQALMDSPTWNSLSEMAKQKILDASTQMGDAAPAAEESGNKIGEGATKGTTESISKGQDQINEAAKQMAEGITKVIEDTLGIAGANSTKANEYGEAVSRSLGEGIKHQTGSAQNAATGLANQVRTAVQTGTAKSYFEAMGRNVSSGVASGIQSGSGEAKTAASSLATSVKSTVQEGLPQSAFVEIGKNVGAGLAQGIEAGKSEAINAATKLAEETIAAAKAKLQIHSPSKVFQEIGTFCVTGFNKGLDSMSVESTIGRNIDNTLSAMVANASGGGSGFTQNITINSRSMSPDEVAREMRLEAKYGLMGGVTVE